MASKGNSLLMPIGFESALFSGISSEGALGTRFDFGFDVGAIPYLLVEVLSQGATGLHVISDPRGFELAQKLRDASLAGVRASDKSGSVAKRTRAIFEPLAASLGFDPDQLGPTPVPLTPPVLYGMDLPPESRATWSRMCEAYNAVYQLLLGMQARTMVAIPVERSIILLQGLLAESRDPTARIAPAAVMGALRTYKHQSVPAVLPLDMSTSSVSEQWIRGFRDLLDDVTYQTYCATKHELGRAERVEGALTRMGVLALRVVRSGPFSSLVKFGQKSISISSGVPVEELAVAPSLQKVNYMPPIVDVSHSLRRAHRRWMDSLAPRKPMHMQVPGFEWIGADYYRQHMVAEISTDWLLSEYVLKPPLTAKHLKGSKSGEYWAVLRKVFDEHIAARAGTDVMCETHGVSIGRDDVQWDWDQEQSKLCIEMDACCEGAARHTVARILGMESP